MGEMSMLQSVFRLAVLMSVVGLGQTCAEAITTSIDDRALFASDLGAAPTGGLGSNWELLYCPGPPLDAPPQLPTGGLGSNGEPIATPEPSALVLAGLGLMGLLACGRRRYSRA